MKVVKRPPQLAFFDRHGLATFTACALGAWVGLFTGLFYFRRARTAKVAASKKKKS